MMWRNVLQTHCNLRLCFAVFVVGEVRPLVEFARGRRFNHRWAAHLQQVARGTSLATGWVACGICLTLPVNREDVAVAMGHGKLCAKYACS